MSRAFDIVGASLLVLVALPILLCVSLAILIDGGPPIFFVQERVGRNGRNFKIIKFRTMTPSDGGLQITSSSDSRITRVGGHLRALKLDELPQLINVLRGEMSIVGPRPEVRHYVDMFPELFAPVLQARPGITDPASLAFRNEQDLLAESDDPERTYIENILPRKIELSRDYVDNKSIINDLRVLLRTIREVIL